MDKNVQIQKVITVYVPGSICNMRCSYCYVTEGWKRGHEEKSLFKYSVEHMIKAFRPDRIGGIAYIAVIGGGETLIPPEVVPFVKGLLAYGHVVEVVTNNTLDDRIEELLDVPAEYRARLIVKCSLHWNELIRLNKVDSYFANIKKIIASGASAYPFLVICDEYADKLEEICEICQRELGALPLCTPCVVGEDRDDWISGGALRTSPPCTPEFVQQIKEQFHSRLFSESVRFLDIDPQKVFCYAGKYSFVVEMGEGIINKCHNIPAEGNFFENIDVPYEGDYVGCECGIASCNLQYCLFGFGLIPEVPNVPTYAELVCERENLFSEEIKRLTNVHICKGSHVLTEQERIEYLMKQIVAKNKEIEKIKCNFGAILSGAPSKENVTKLLAMVEANQLSYQELKEVSYGYLWDIYKVCATMEQGDALYISVLEKIYKGLLDSYDYEGIDILYDRKTECELVKGIKNISITSMVVCEEYCEAMQRGLLEKNYQELARIYYEQIKNW